MPEVPAPLSKDPQLVCAEEEGCAESRMARVLGRMASLVFLCGTLILIALIGLFYDRFDFTLGDVALPSSALPSLGAVIIAAVLAGLLVCVVGLGRRRGASIGGEGLRTARSGTRRREISRVKKSPFLFGGTVWGLSLALFVVQAAFIHMIYGFPGWDSGNILSHAILLASGRDMATARGLLTGDAIVGYFDTYPNNAFLTWVFMGIVRVASVVGLDSVFACDIVGALSVSVGGAFMALFARRVTGSSTVAYVGLGLYALLFSLSPWISMPYSDTYASGFIGAELYLSACLLMGKREEVESRKCPVARPFPVIFACSVRKWLVLALVALIGYLIKPTAAIVLMAAAVVWAIWLLRGNASPRLARVFGLFAGLVVSAALVFGVISPASYRAVGVDADSNKTFGMSHFFMMGQNSDALGGYSDEDVTFSASIADPGERAKAEKAMAFERIGERGLSGNLAFYAKKLLFSFGDGTFSWALDGRDRFFTEIYPKSGPVAHAVRSLFYRVEWQADADQTAFRTVTQVLWYAVIVLWAVAALGGVVHPRGCAYVRPGGMGFPLAALVPVVTLMGLAIYLLIFEDRARYLYCFGPVSIACAAIGLAAGARALGSMLEGFRAHRSTARTVSVGRGEPRVPGELPIA